jgi:RNA-directed DNA polymerase
LVHAASAAFLHDNRSLRGVERFSTQVAAILAEEGFRVNYRKTWVMRQGVRQQLAGLVAIERFHFRRTDFDRLKVTLNNWVRFGPACQNWSAHPHFREYLEG